MDATELWILNNKKVCLCMGITRKKVVDAIKNGAHTVESVNKVVGSGRGGCGGKRCGATIPELIQQHLDGTLEG